MLRVIWFDTPLVVGPMHRFEEVLPGLYEVEDASGQLAYGFDTIEPGTDVPTTGDDPGRDS